MGVSNSTPNSIIVRKYSEGNCDKLIDDYKITSIKNKAKLLQTAQKMTVKKKRKNPNQTKIFYMLI